MVREPAAVLRAALALLALGAWNLLAPVLPEPATAVQVAVLAIVTLPVATLAVRAVWRAGAGRVQALAVAAAIAGALAAALIWAGLAGTPATLAKLVAATCIGAALATLLSGPLELVAIALVVAGVDAYSVAAGPTRVIVDRHPDVLSAFTLAFHPPGTTGVAQVGASDFVFFSLFLGAAARLGLRAQATWAAMTASFGATLTLSYALELALPALPLLSFAVLAANGDLLLRRVRAARDA